MPKYQAITYVKNGMTHLYQPFHELYTHRIYIVQHFKRKLNPTFLDFNHHLLFPYSFPPILHQKQT